MAKSTETSGINQDMITDGETQREYLKRLYLELGASIDKINDPDQLASIAKRLRKIRENIENHPIDS